MKLQLMFADIEGIKFKNETYVSGVAAFPMIGLEMPE